MSLFGVAKAILRPDVDYGEVLQRAMEEQKRLDLFDIQCQACGGLGVVMDLANRWYQGDEMVYGGKRCGECDGLGSPRGSD